jgi:hypothetical protein
VEAGFGQLYDAHFPDGSTKRGTELGAALKPGDTLQIDGVECRVIRVEPGDDVVDYHLHVEPVEH